MIEASTVRAVLESLAAGLAAKKCTGDDIAILEDMFAQMVNFAEAGDETNRIRANTRFHDEIIRISDHSLIAKLSKTLRFASWSRMKGIKLGKKAAFHLVRRHRKIIDALAAHDVAAAEEAMRRHIEETIP
jgi:DNA-binding GntR family transcriptional regulator